MVPEGYRRLSDLEGEGQEMFHCFTKDAEGKICQKLAICLWDGGERGDDWVTAGVGATHERSGRDGLVVRFLERVALTRWTLCGDSFSGRSVMSNR